MTSRRQHKKLCYLVCAITKKNFPHSKVVRSQLWSRYPDTNRSISVNYLLKSEFSQLLKILDKVMDYSVDYGTNKGPSINPWKSK